MKVDLKIEETLCNVFGIILVSLYKPDSARTWGNLQSLTIPHPLGEVYRLTSYTSLHPELAAAPCSPFEMGHQCHTNAAILRIITFSHKRSRMLLPQTLCVLRGCRAVQKTPTEIGPLCAPRAVQGIL